MGGTNGGRETRNQENNPGEAEVRLGVRLPRELGLIQAQGPAQAGSSISGESCILRGATAVFGINDSEL